MELARASSKAYKEKLEADIKIIVRKATEVEGRVELSKAKKLISVSYYKHWSISAIHILITCADFRDIPSLVRRLALSEEKINESIDILEETGVVKRVAGQKLETLSHNLFAKKGTVQEKLHAQNWRLRLMQESNETIKYTALFGLSQTDANKMRDILLQAIKEVRSVAVDSQPLDGYALSIDFSFL